jgi:hypothetical protein
MNPHSGIDDNNKKDRTKAIATAIPMAGILVAAALLSALSFNNYEPAIAQQEQNMTAGAGGNATTAAGGNATTAAGGNQTSSEVMMHLEEVRTAIENDDDDAALMHLDLALNALGGNMTTTTGGGNTTTASGGAAAEDGEDEEDEED